MALTATFTANFASFYDAVDKAVVKLKDIDASAGKVEKGLDKMVESFSGKKVITEALLMEKAIGGVEGIVKLTEKEIERLGNTTNEAVEKMKKLGQDVPPGLQAIADKTKAADKSTADWSGTLLKFASAAGIAFSVDSVLRFAKSIFDTAGKIQDMSEKLGVSTRAVQGWTFAAEQTGASMENIGKAVIAMSQTIAGDEKSATASLDKLGVKFADIKAMKPEDAFNVIASAIKDLPNPMDQAKVAMELFGKAGVELLPAIRAGMVDVAEGADKMSDATVKRLADAGDAWAKFANAVTIYSGEALAAVMDAVEGMTASWGHFGRLLQSAISGNWNAFTLEIGNQADALKAHTTVTTTATGAVAGLNTEERKTKDAADKAKDAILAHNRAIQGMVDQLVGKSLAKKVDDLAEAIQKAGGFAKVTAFEQEKLVKTVIDMWQQGAKLPPVLEEIWAKYGAIHVMAGYVATDIGLVTRQFENQVPAVVALGKSFYDVDQNVKWLDEHVKAVGNTMNLPGGVDWTKWHPPPIVETEWDKFGKRVGDVARGITDDFSRSIVDMATGAVSFHDGVLRIWDSIKEGVRRILADMLSTFLNQYIAGLIGGYAKYLGYVTSGAVAGPAVGAVAGPAVGAASGAGGSGLGAAAWGPWAAAALPFILGELIIPFSHEDPHTRDQDSAIPGLANAQAMFDYLGPASSVWQDFIAAHPEFVGHGNGFARGTHGQYLNFGAGTPVMLHGYEKVVPRGNAETGEWAPSVVINIHDPVIREHQDIDRLADAMAVRLQARGL